MTTEGSSVAIGIDAAVVANHHIVVRRPEAGRSGEVVDDFVAAPTLSGMDGLTKRLAKWPGAIAVAEPTSMTWLPLAVALNEAGVELALVGNRHSARLRSALAGKNKSDPIDAGVLSRAGEFFDLAAARIPSPTGLALRRAAQRRGKVIVEVNRCLRRVISQARWAFPDRGMPVQGPDRRRSPSSPVGQISKRSAELGPPRSPRWWLNTPVEWRT
ncbi:MAG: IS110 family transposase [Acidimicrobiales bacterium]